VRLLIVEDERDLAAHLAKGLREEGFAVDLAATLAEARERAIDAPYDLVLLDRRLPDGDGHSLLGEWRGQGLAAPVLVLTARDLLSDKIAALDAGADDYLTKPFAFAELLARVRALLRRRGLEPAAVLEIDDLRLDRTARLAERGGEALELTPKEFALLEYLMLRPGAVSSRAEIAEHVWDLSYEARSNVIDVIVARLRRKLEAGGRERLIQSVPGVGYAVRGRERKSV
jgi:DNA-binding response OmpR family regulator